MALTEAQLLKAIEAQSEKALKIIAQEVERRSLGLVPINTGKLKKSQRIEKTKDGFVLVVGEGLPYANTQYFDDLRHLWQGNQPKRILDAFKPNRTGGTDASRYSSGYKKAREANALKKTSQVLTKVSKTDGGIRWFERILSDPDQQKKLGQIFLKAFIKG